MEFTLIWRERKMNRDRYDLPLTTVSDRAAALYRDGADRILSAWNGAGDAFDSAIIEDPAFALAPSARARVHQLNMEFNEARAKAAQARQLAATVTRRERQHVEITAAAIEGQPGVALAGAGLFGVGRMWAARFRAHLSGFAALAIVSNVRCTGAFSVIVTA